MGARRALVRSRLLVALALLLATATAQDSPHDFTNTPEGFKLTIPQGWERHESPWTADTDYSFQLAPRGGQGAVGFAIYLTEVPDLLTAKTARDAHAKMRYPDRANLVARDETLGGHATPCLAYTKKAGPRTLAFRQHYFVEKGICHIAVTWAPEGDPRTAELDAVLASLTVTGADRGLYNLRRMARKCASDIDWARDWKSAAERASSEKKLVLVAIERTRGIAPSGFFPSSVFMDADLVTLVKERFVPLRWTRELDAPFLKPEIYGLGSATFGHGALIVSPAGRVLADAPSVLPVPLFELARETLAAHPEASGPAFDPKDPVALLRRGDHDAAAKLLDAPKTAVEWRLRALLLRRQRKGAEALAALAEARKLGSPFAADEGQLLLRTGQPLAAEKVLAPWCENHIDAEADYWLALARLARLGPEGARESFTKITKFRDGPPAWRAAAVLLGLGVMTGLDPIFWPEEKTLELCRAKPYAPLSTDEAPRAEKEALAFLLASQRTNGSWPSPFTLHGARSPTEAAIAALAGAALLEHSSLEHPGDAKAKTAASAALDFVLSFDLDRPRSAAAFDNGVWARIFALRFLARCLKEKLGDTDKVLARAKTVVTALEKTQLPTGGWTYFQGAGDPRSVSFVTAAALLALNDAKKVQVPVPDALVERAAKVVLSLRRPDGTFDYMEGKNEAVSSIEGAARSPLCALALARSGQGDAAGIAKSLAAFFEHRSRIRKERGKGLCHTAPEATASYYLLFGYSFAAEALPEVGDVERAAVRAALLEDVLHLRAADGSFCDNPQIGRCPGTALALLTLRRLDARR